MKSPITTRKRPNYRLTVRNVQTNVSRTVSFETGDGAELFRKLGVVLGEPTWMGTKNDLTAKGIK